MQTNFTLAQLADPDIAESEKILRNCVHCGFCTATCPTYVTLGDELDSPRGRIYQIKDMLENDKPASTKLVKHIDRCLSCLSCMTTCPSGVNYMHLVDHARAHIHKTHKRPLGERLLRAMLAATVPYPARFRLSLLGAWFARPLAGLMPGRLKGMIGMAPKRLSRGSDVDRPQVHRAEGKARGRVALMTGCAQQVLSPAINESTVRLLNRCGIDVVVADGAGCCGALVHHMGDVKKGHGQAAANIRAWVKEMDGEGLDAVIINASGCGTTVKDYGFMFREDKDMAADAARVSEITLDITEYLDRIGLPDAHIQPELRLAYHSACSLQHGQKVTDLPKSLLQKAGFDVQTPPESHLCCGSAGTYNMLQPELAGKLLERKVANIRSVEPQAIAAGNIGCITQIAGGMDLPVLHTVELLDWITGGPKPKKLN